MKKLAFILNDLDDGGVQRRTLRLIEVMSNRYRDLDIYLIVGKDGGEHYNKIPPLIKLEHLDASKQGLGGSLLKSIQRIRPDVVICCMGQQLVSLVVSSFFQLGSGKPFPKLFVIQAVPIRLRGAGALKNIVRIMGARIFYRFADQIICVSRAVENSVSSVSATLSSKAITIYNPVVSDSLTDRSLEPLPEHRFVDNDSILLVAVGRLDIQKDYITMLAAIEILVSRGLPIRLLILGSGPMRDELNSRVVQAGLKDNVELLGFVDNPYPYLARADIFVMSSLWEGLPNALVEALALGVKTVSTDCEAGPNEILEGGNWGTLVPVQNPLALAEGITKELSTERDSGGLIRRGQQFHCDIAAKNYRMLIEQALSAM